MICFSFLQKITSPSARAKDTTVVSILQVKTGIEGKLHFFPEPVSEKIFHFSPRLTTIVMGAVV